MSNEQQIRELIRNLKATEAPGYDDPRDARTQVGKFHKEARDKLLTIGAPAVPFLIEESKSPEFRDLITDIGDGAIEHLLAHLKENPDSPFLEYVIVPLGRLKAKSASELLLNYLKTSDNLDVRVQAALALGRIHKDQEKIDVAPMFELLDTLLIDAQTDSNGQYDFLVFQDSVRCEDVVMGINYAGDKRATDRLVKLLEKSKGTLRLRITQALEHIDDNKQNTPTPQDTQQPEDKPPKMPTHVSAQQNPTETKPDTTSELQKDQKSETKKPSKILIAVGIGAAVLCVCCIVASLAVTFFQ